MSRSDSLMPTGETNRGDAAMPAPLHALHGGRRRRAWTLRVALALALIAVAVLAGRAEALNQHQADPMRLPADTVNFFWARLSILIAAAQALVVGAVALPLGRRHVAVKIAGVLGAVAGIVALWVIALVMDILTFAGE